MAAFAARPPRRRAAGHLRRARRAGIGTIGLAGEWAWNQTWVVNEWAASSSPRPRSSASRGARRRRLGGFVGRALTPGVERPSGAGLAVPVAAVIAVAVVAYPIPLNAGTRSAPLQLNDTSPTASARSPGCHARPARRRRRRPLVPDHQLAGRRRHQEPGAHSSETAPAPTRSPSRSRSTAPGRRPCACTTAAGSSACRSSFPPTGDPGRGGAGPPRSTREFILDKDNLQREVKEDVPGWLTLVAYLAVSLLAFGLIAIVAWGLRRLEAKGSGPHDPSAEPAGVGPGRETEEGQGKRQPSGATPAPA